MKGGNIVDALKDDLDLQWDEPFFFRMNEIRRLMEYHGFRFNHILHYFKIAEENGHAKILHAPEGNESEDVIIAEFPGGMGKEYYGKGPGWGKQSLMDQMYVTMRYKEPPGDPYEVRFTMELCRSYYFYFGFTYDECYRLFMELERDGFMQVLKKPNDTLMDHEVVAKLTKQITDEYYKANRERWRL